MHELQLQEGIGQASGEKVRLTQGSGIVAELERTLDLRVIPLPEGSVCVESNEGHIVINIVKNISLNLATLPLQTVHALHHGVSEELQIIE